MSLQATCDNCQRQLWVDDVAEPRLTCPRCLHAVRNPWYDRAATGVERPAEVAPRSDGLECLSCGEPLKPHWRSCPQCRTPIYPQERRAPKPVRNSLERDVRRDRLGSLIGVGTLGGLLLLGVIVFLCSGGIDLIRSPEGFTVFLFASLIMSTIVVGLGFLLYFSRNTTVKIVATTVGSVLATTIVVLGIAIVIVIAIVAAICSGISSFLNTCNCKPPPKC